MSDNIVIFPRKLLIKFIQLYKEQPCLWDRKCPMYKQKKKRLEAISKLTALLQQHFPRATRVHVLRKIESLRACVRREYKRVRDSRVVATNPDEVYTPHLWYYDLCSFVFGEDGSNFLARQGANEEVAESEEEASEDLEDNDDHKLSFEEYNVSMSSVGLSDNFAVQKHQSLSDEDAKTSKRHCTEIEDEYDAIGINVAAKLRGLPANMRILAEKLVNDVLFQAQINGLTSATFISTPDPFKSGGSQ